MTNADFQAVVDLTAEEFEHESMPIRLKDVIQGCANGGYITLPKWIQKHAEAYQIYYAVHEMVHYIAGDCHDSIFQSTEDGALALWGIEIKRRRIYPKSMKIDGKNLTYPHDVPFRRVE